MPCDKDDVTTMDFVGVESGAEADLTVDSSTGMVLGRVAGADGRVFLVEEAVDGNGHVWLEVEIKDDSEMGNDEIEPVRRHSVDKICFLKTLLTSSCALYAACRPQARDSDPEGDGR